MKAQLKEETQNTLLPRKAAMCGQHKEHANTGMYFCDLNGKRIIMDQILWCETSRQNLLYTCANP